MRRLRLFGLVGVVVGLMLGRGATAAAAPLRQAATPTPPPIRVEVFEDVNVRAGPGTDYDLIGKMIPGQSGAVLGQTINGPFHWLKIEYIGGPDNTGWVLKDLVRVVGDLSTIPHLALLPTPTRPPTATPEVVSADGTATSDPNAGRLPTFTPPPPVVRPTLLPAVGANTGRGFPPALAIISLFVFGGFGLLVSLLRRRA